MGTDQAEKLRQLIRKYRKDQYHHADVIAVLSGKGGVGKSVFSTNFSIALGRTGKRVLLIDLDIGMGNIEHMLGHSTLSSVADCIHDHLALHDAIFHGPGNLSFIPGGNSLAELFQIDERNMNIFLNQVDDLKKNYDYIILDFGAGVNQNMLHFLLAAKRMILITTPEPPALADAYSTLKIIGFHYPKMDTSIVINMVDDLSEGKEAWNRISETAERFLHMTIHWLTSLHRDRAVTRSIKEQVPCVVQYPRTRYSIEMKLLAGAFLTQKEGFPKVRQDTTFGERVRIHFRRLRGGKG
jgi:flagellar biosynthesis protein FlhG